MKLTLDTNAARDLLQDRAKRPLVDRLITLAHDGVIDLAVTGHVRDDVPLEPLASRLNELPELGLSIAGGVFRLGVSALDGGDVLGDSEIDSILDALAETVRSERRRPDQCDRWHLHAHRVIGRDIFVTSDRGILQIADELERLLGVVVRRLDEEFVGRVEATV